MEQLKKNLRESVLSNDIESLKKIINMNSFDLNSKIDYNGLTLLHLAVQQNKLVIVDFLCSQKGINQHSRDNIGRIPLHYACSKGININILKILLCGSDVNAQTIGGETPLMKAIFFNNIEAAKVLLRFGADTTIKNQSDDNANTIALREGKKEISKLIEEYYTIFRTHIVKLVKLCMLLFSYLKFKDSQDRSTVFSKFTPEMIKKLTRYIIL